MSTNKINKSYDLLIIGGGIAGAGVAQAAVAAGYTVLLLEKNAFGSQTSSRSSKLIHGGLRYLETAQIGLVRDSLRERRALLKLAPGLVKPIPFYIPVYKKSRRGKWILRAALSLYCALAGFERLARFKELPKDQWSRLTGLKTEGLLTVFQYWDAQTDDKVITEAVMKSAHTLGANTLSHAQFLRAEKIADDEGHGYQISYQFEGEQHQCVSRCIINATGPWVNVVAECITPAFDKLQIDLVQGTHIIIDEPPPHRVYYLESTLDQRVIFVMPWHGKTMIGTTEVMVTDINKEITPSQQEVDYLLSIYKHYFPDASNIIESKFAGVRVLPHSDKKAFNRSRESQLWSPENHPDVRMVYGGKLTTFRSISQELVKWLRTRIGEREALANLDELKIE